GRRFKSIDFFARSLGGRADPGRMHRPRPPLRAPCPVLVAVQDLGFSTGNRVVSAGRTADMASRGVWRGQREGGLAIMPRMKDTAGTHGYKKSVPREYLESVVVAVILALFIRTFVVQAFKIPTGSMETNLLIGDHLLVNKVIYSPSAIP